MEAEKARAFLCVLLENLLETAAYTFTELDIERNPVTQAKAIAAIDAILADICTSFPAELLVQIVGPRFKDAAALYELSDFV